MKVRKFFAPSSREALKLVRAELGADAVVLSNRVVDGGVELVALTEDTLSGIVEAPTAPSAAPVSPSETPVRIEPSLRGASGLPIEADPFDDVEPFEGYGPSAFGTAPHAPFQGNAFASRGGVSGALPSPESGRGSAGQPGMAAASLLQQARPAGASEGLPGGFARRAFPTLQPTFEGPSHSQQGRRFTPRDEAPMAERSDRDRRLARPVETREDARQVSVQEGPRAPAPYRPAPGLHSPLMHPDNTNGRDRTRALPGVLAAKAVGDDGASALAYVHRATQTAYLQQRRARAEAEAAAGLSNDVSEGPGQPGAERMADAGWTGEARSPRQPGHNVTTEADVGRPDRTASAGADAWSSDPSPVNGALLDGREDDIRRDVAYGDASDGQDAAAHYGHDAYANFETNEYGGREHSAHDEAAYYDGHVSHADAAQPDGTHMTQDDPAPVVPFARAAERGRHLSGVAGLARPERDGEESMQANVLGLSRAERDDSSVVLPTAIRPARDAAGLSHGDAAATPMTASEAMARGLGNPGEVVVRPASMPREEQDRTPLPESALMERDTPPGGLRVGASNDDVARQVASAMRDDVDVDTAPAADRAGTTISATSTPVTSQGASPMMAAREYGATRYAAHTRVKASFATFPHTNPAIGNPIGGLRATPSLPALASHLPDNADLPASFATAPQSRDISDAATASVADAVPAAAPALQAGVATDDTAPATASAATGTFLNDAFGVDVEEARDSAADASSSIPADTTPASASAPAITASMTNDPSPRSATAVLEEMRNLCGALGLQLEAIDQSERIRRDPVRNGVTQMMLACGFSAQLVRLMLDKLPAVHTPEEGLAWVKATFERNLPVLDNEDALMERGGVFALMGPTGVGKTTTTAKLAARAVMRHGADRVALLTTDSYRIGAHEQLRIYGRILGVAVHAVKDASDLSLVLSELRNKHMVLIDTIGMSQRDRAVSEQVAMLRGAQMPVKRLLLLNATSHGDTLNEVVRAYGSAINAAAGGNAGEADGGLSGCIITKVDESNGIGAALDTVMRHRLPVHYVSNGQKVPEDLRVARRGYLIDNAFSDPHRTSPFQPDAEALEMLFAGENDRAARSTSTQGIVDGPRSPGQPSPAEAHYGSSHG
ncbi:flagellar biosynthesis protein FlhF [Robbsia andropogonis]|uniref:flagellar biosynthesis protein FlhF n=1 Tax=Robbsia andropogonis TaxID=28092 RepID=UPI0006980F19